MPRGGEEDKLGTGCLLLTDADIRTCETALGFMAISMYNNISVM